MNDAMFLHELRTEIEKDSRLLVLTVIRMALQDLEKGKSWMDAVRRITVDLDKLDRNSYFTTLCKDTSKVVQAYDLIKAENEKTNEDRGSSVARAMLLYLSRNDLRSAVTTFQVDGDKVRQYPRLNRQIEQTIIGCRNHGTPYYCHKCEG